ncbi:hypothetical protein NW759_012121 [Fusarium solani]|jgi:hypothetical protein|nr:hypothetical protein NW759_012121 [Fusarium solani]
MQAYRYLCRPTQQWMRHARSASPASRSLPWPSQPKGRPVKPSRQFSTRKHDTSDFFPPGTLDPLPIPLDHPAWWEAPIDVVRDRLKRASVEWPNMRSSHLCYPSPEEGIPEVREELKDRPWGLVTYRTAYGGHSDRQFLKLRELIHDTVLKFQESDDKRFPMGQAHWPVIENKKLLSNVTTQVVREQFSKWASDRGVPSTEDGWSYQVARFHYCLIADRRSLKSAETTFPIIGVLYKDWLPAWHPDRIGHEGKYVPDDWTPIEGNTEGDVGWFYCRVVCLGWRYDEMCVRGLWGTTPRLPCGRPPYVVHAPSRLRRWRGDKAEGHYRTPS